MEAHAGIMKTFGWPLPEVRTGNYGTETAFPPCPKQSVRMYCPVVFNAGAMCAETMNCQTQSLNARCKQVLKSVQRVV